MGRMLNTRGLPETQKIELVLPIETQKTGWYAFQIGHYIWIGYILVFLAVIH